MWKSWEDGDEQNRKGMVVHMVKVVKEARPTLSEMTGKKAQRDSVAVLYIEGCQYFGHLMQRADSLEKTMMLGKIFGRRRRRW